LPEGLRLFVYLIIWGMGLRPIEKFLNKWDYIKSCLSFLLCWVTRGKNIGVDNAMARFSLVAKFLAVDDDAAPNSP
jgi:hypothetical protein